MTIDLNTKPPSGADRKAGTIRADDPDETLSANGGSAGAVLTIDLGAIAKNYRSLRSRLHGAACAAVVKADAYGLGAARVAPTLAAEGCEHFFVAHLAEGTALRAVLGRDATIYVLNGLPTGTEKDCSAAGLVPVLNSLEQVSAWRDAARAAGRRLPAVIQLDSGMSRLGISQDEVERVADDPQALEGIDLKLVMSHLCCADEPGHPANEMQRARFAHMASRLPQAPWSLSNSSGIFLGNSYHHAIARPGAALYGVNPTPAEPNPMRPVVKLSARVIQLRDLPEGAGVGYGYTFHAPHAIRAASISIGYADGWPRCAAAAAFFNKERLPFIGRVSMDSIVIDISALPAGALNAGDFVDLIGEMQDVDAVAALAGTIGYEILTGLGNRFERRYVDA